MLKASEYIGLMSHALGKTPDSRHNLWDTFNRAGRALFTRHDWTWRMEGPISLPVVANQDFVVLPVDFAGEVESWIPNTGTYQFLEKCSLEKIANLRATFTTNIISGRFCVYYPGWDSQDSAETEPTRRALLYPTPTANANPTIQLIYRRRWVNISENDNDRVPNIPSEFEQALILQSRAYAVCIENQVPPYEDGPLAVEIARLINEDSTAQPSLGRMTGGVDRRLGRQWSGGDRYPARASL